MIGIQQARTDKKTGESFPKRGEIYWVDLNPTRGGETSKKRPGLVISNDIGNEISRVVLIAPITSKVFKIYPFEVETVVDGKKAKIMLNQVRAVDKSRLEGKIGTLDEELFSLIDEALKIVFALN